MYAVWPNMSKRNIPSSGAIVIPCSPSAPPVSSE